MFEEPYTRTVCGTLYLRPHAPLQRTKMRLIIRDSALSASEYVANYIVERIKTFNPTLHHPFVLGLPTGSSPLIVYKILVEKYKSGQVSFENVVTFNMVRPSSTTA